MSSAPPNVDDPTTKPYWDGCYRHELLLQYSPSADRYQFYPRPVLAGHGATDLEWRPASGHAIVEAMVTVRAPMVPDRPPPYIVAIVRLAEGPTMMTNIEAPDGALPDCRIGSVVQLAWRDRAGGPPVPIFMPAA